MVMTWRKYCVILLLFAWSPCAWLHAQAWTIPERNISITLNNSSSGVHTFAEVMSYSTLVVGIGQPLTQFIYSMAKWNDHAFKDCLTSSLGLGLSVGLAYVAKLTYNRERPYNAYPDDIYSYGAPGFSTSFPSNHTGMAFESATMLTLQYRYWYVGVPAYLWAVTVGYSRLNLGEHYITDVAVGALLGTASAVASYYIMDAIWRKVDNKYILKPKTTDFDL